MAIALDVVGAGGTGQGPSAITFNSGAGASGAWAFLAVVAQSEGFSPSISAVTYGGTSMTQLGTIPLNNVTTHGVMWLFGLSNIPAGVQTVSFTVNGGFFCAANTVSYTGVGSVGVAQTAFGASATASIAVSGTTAGQWIVASLANQGNFSMNTATGGSNRIKTANGNETIEVNDATSDTTFSAGLPNSDFWGAVAVILTAGGGPPPADPTAGAPLIPNIPNQFVGPMALRVNKRLPVPPRNMRPLSDGANQAVTFRTAPADNVTPLYQFLNNVSNGRNAKLQFIGDSTVSGVGDASSLGGWVGQMGPLIGEAYNVTVIEYTGSNTTLYTGGGSNTVTLVNSGVAGTTLGSDEGTLASGNYDTTPSPDCIFIQDSGFNDLTTGGLTVGQWVSAYQLFITNLQARYPGVALVVTTANISSTIDTTAAYAALATALCGTTTPLSPPLQASTVYRDVWLLDTRQAFYSVYQSGYSYDGIHPNEEGYRIQAYWTLAQLAPGMVTPIGAKMPPLQVPNPQVGPVALRQSKRMPYVPYRSPNSSAFSDGANVTITWTTTDDGFVQPGGRMPPLQIPNPFVGPMAMRQGKRMPYQGYRAASFSDGANQTVTFTTSTNGRRGIKDGANQTINFGFSTQGVRGVRDGANIIITFTTSDDGFVTTNRPIPPLIIPNPFVGPMALRNRKRMPYVPSATLAQQALSDGANSSWVFTTSTNGRRGITAGANTTIVFSDSPAGVRGVRDGANITITASFVDAGRRGIRDGANQTITVHTSITAKQGFRDGANLHLVFSTSDDGFVHPFLIDVAGKVVVGPGEIRSVTLPPGIWSTIVRGVS